MDSLWQEGKSGFWQTIAGIILIIIVTISGIAYLIDRTNKGFMDMAREAKELSDKQIELKKLEIRAINDISSLNITPEEVTPQLAKIISCKEGQDWYNCYYSVNGSVCIERGC
jgi:hypothetical protein